MMATKPRKISAEDLLTMRFVSGPQLSPDGTLVAFVLRWINPEKNRYFSNLWLVPTDGGEPRRFTVGDYGDISPRWSPDGRRIAFISDRSDSSQIWLIPVDGGEAEQLGQLEEGSLASLAWSPDGTKIAFAFRAIPPADRKEERDAREEEHGSYPPRVIRRAGYREDGAGYNGGERWHLQTVCVETGHVNQLTSEDYDDRSPAWSPDGRTIAFVSNRTEDGDLTPGYQDLWLIPSDGGAARRVTKQSGHMQNPVWSPDGAEIACIGHDRPDEIWGVSDPHLRVVSVESGEAQDLTVGIDRPVGHHTLGDTSESDVGAVSLIWSADGARLFFLVSDQGSCHLYAVNRNGGEPRQLTQGAIDVCAFSADSETTRLVLQIGSFTEPGDVYLLPIGDAEGNTPVRLTDVNREWNAELALSDAEEIWFDTYDGGKIHGWIVKPPDFDPQQKYPLILEIHGGPHTQYGNAFFHEFQFLAARGYVVIYTNPRGSKGYGETYAAAIRGDWGGPDFDDLMAAVDYVIDQGYVDSERLGVTGGSYGGFMTNWIVSHTDRFKAAVTQRSVTNMISMAGTCDVQLMGDRTYFSSEVWEDPTFYWKLSPLSHVQNISTPLLILHSEGDLRCPIEQAEQLFIALKRLKREVEFVRYPPEASHDLSRSGPPDLRIHRLNRIVEWMDKHLQ
ncbi:MAG: S9 family peptidase [Candidatus Poribacteria bacterium]|nr:S9 family peptidase [Candidatus Poribacteria bacterium]